MSTHERSETAAAGDTTEAEAKGYRALSLWHDGYPGSFAPRAALPGPRSCDVAIVGAGYTGLWTAYYLKRADPGLRVIVLEKETAGFGASGRNGGWCSAIYPASMHKVASRAGADAARRLQRAMNATVAEVGVVARQEQIECGYTQGGYVSLARNRAQMTRAEAEVRGWHDWGLPDQLRLLSAADATSHCRATRVFGGTYTPHCAAVDPTRLVRGLADVVEGLGVTLHEGTAVTGLEPHVVHTVHGSVRADVVIRATEGYTPLLPDAHRDVVPMYSLMVATEPLPASTWDELGLAARETFSDKRHLRIYGQRTEDGRLAFGGRGAPYHYGSRIGPDFDRDPRVHHMLQRILVDLFPPLSPARFTHRWGGNLGIPRDWDPAVWFDRRTGVGGGGGYVGDGVATANLTGRCLSDLILGVDSELTQLPIVRERSRRWEPEPLRWLGVNLGTAIFALADQTEARTGRPSRLAHGFWRLLGH